ncbi:Bug family tripartite tricarboxylate transporter substrate binding protein [Verticiella alkaliphila]|uniref:Bug family tripartite tricarboxylate transporter substrate binding protein n=1 Tax=Verticiella alkaliphila TaxID=2779529 RepID=UPI00209B0207|nr:tripartite tricarboxylate transporter substrate-binding protein [Verticiella sp. GG226]
MSMKTTMLVASTLMAALAAPMPSFAQDKPTLKVIVGFPPGGSADLLTRLLANGLQNDYTVVVENRPGAAGRIALNAAKNAKPDGQTVLVVPAGPMVVFPHAYKQLDYDPVKDFAPISLIARTQFGIVAGPASGATTIAEMIAKIKADPLSGTYGTPGSGTMQHFLGGMFSQAAGVPMEHVGFQGGSPANVALLGGHINYKFDVVSESAELHRTGKVRILAVAGDERDPVVPDVPTLREQGVDMSASVWFGMYAPAATPPDVRQRLEDAVVAALHQPELRERIAKQGYEPVGSSSAELAQVQQADLKRWEAPIKASGVALD